VAKLCGGLFLSSELRVRFFCFLESLSYMFWMAYSGFQSAKWSKAVEMEIRSLVFTGFAKLG
jgi:hypothetical protein